MRPEDYLPLCDSIGRSFARSYPAVEAEDISQELAAFLCERGSDIDAYVRKAEANEEAYVRTCLTRQATLFARKESAEILHFTAQYSYRPDEVRKMAPAWISYLEDLEAYDAGTERATETEVDDETSAVSSVDTISHDLEGLGDISLAWGRISEHYRRIIRRTCTGDEMDASARKEATRAFDALTAQMNSLSHS